MRILMFRALLLLATALAALFNSAGRELARFADWAEIEYLLAGVKKKIGSRR